MTRKEQNFLAMGKAAVAALDKYAADWQANKRVKRSADGAKAIIAEIESRNQGAQAKTEGTTSQKHDAADRAAELAAKIAKRVKVYATDEHNLDLKQKMSFSATDYHHMTDADLTAQLQNLIAAVSPLIADLGDYGVSQPMLDELGTLAQAFKDLESQPRNIVSERKMHNAAIPELITMLRADLHAIDGLIGIFENDNLESEYKNARIIIDRPGSLR